MLMLKIKPMVLENLLWGASKHSQLRGYTDLQMFILTLNTESVVPENLLWGANKHLQLRAYPQMFILTLKIKIYGFTVGS